MAAAGSVVESATLDYSMSGDQEKAWRGEQDQVYESDERLSEGTFVKHEETEEEEREDGRSRGTNVGRRGVLATL